MKKNLLLLFVFCFYFSSNSFAQDTSIPDSNFEEFLIRLNIDDVLDGKVETINISGIPRLDILGNSPQSPGKIEDLTGIEDFVSLQILNCNDNSITSIDVSGATVLRQLNCYNNELTSLDVTNNTALELLVCYGNELASLDLSQNPLLTTLNCQDNPPLSCIEVGNETAANAGDPPYTTWMKPATAVYSEDCQSLIPKTYVPDDAFEQALIDLGYDAGLDDYVYTFEIDNVTTLDIAGSDIAVGNIQDLTGIEAFESLNELYCSFNQITDLDLSQNMFLSVIECDNNQLTSLNAKNGTNYLITTFNATDNPSLNCIEVDDEIKAVSGLAPYDSWEKDVKARYSVNCSVSSEPTSIPDSMFEKALMDLGYDAVIDGAVSTAIISGITYLDVTSSYISDLTGIGGFTSLTRLNCSNNLLESIDLSNNTELETFECYHNLFTELDVTSYSSLRILNCNNNELLQNLYINTELESLSCQNNLLSDLTLTSNTNLTYLSCRRNPLGSLDLSGNPALGYLDCYDNQLTDLDLTANPKLGQLDCGFNQLTSLDIGTKNELTALDCRNNQLTSLIVGGAPYLKNLDCHGNNLASLDLSANTGLWRLLCYDNQLENLDLSSNDEMKSLYCNLNKLTSLNVQNGNNVEFLEFNALNNPSLFCIQVDDADLANVGTGGENPYRNWVADDKVIYSEDCAESVAVSVSEEFEDLLIALGIDTDGKNGSIQSSDIYGVTELNIPSGYSISSLAEIDILINLETLIVSDNGLTSLDLSNNAALKYLDCSNNDLTSLDLSDNLLLEYIDVSNNPLTPGSLILPTTYSPYSEAPEHLKSKNSSLANITLLYLNIANTDLTSIDVSDFESLDTLNVSGSKLDSLDVSANVSLRYLNTTSTPLTCIQVNQDQLANIPAGWEKEATASYAVDCQAASGIEDELLAASIRMYPNPVNDVLTVESDFRLTKVEVYSIVGGKVKEIITDFSTIQTGHLSKGIYILKIHSEKGIATKKFTKE